MSDRVAITVEFSMENLGSYEDSYLASLWHLVQINPADGFASREPGDMAEKVGREIIRRFVIAQGVPLWGHQGVHYAAGTRMGLNEGGE